MCSRSVDTLHFRLAPISASLVYRSLRPTERFANRLCVHRRLPPPLAEIASILNDRSAKDKSPSPGATGASGGWLISPFGVLARLIHAVGATMMAASGDRYG